MSYFILFNTITQRAEIHRDPILQKILYSSSSPLGSKEQYTYFTVCVQHSVCRNRARFYLFVKLCEEITHTQFLSQKIKQCYNVS